MEWDSHRQIASQQRNGGQDITAFLAHRESVMSPRRLTGLLNCKDFMTIWLTSVYYWPRQRYSVLGPVLCQVKTAFGLRLFPDLGSDYRVASLRKPTLPARPFGGHTSDNSEYVRYYRFSVQPIIGCGQRL